MSPRGVGPVGQQRDPGWSRERLTFFIREPCRAQKVLLAGRLVSLACHLEGTPCAPLWRPSLGPRLHPWCIGHFRAETSQPGPRPPSACRRTPRVRPGQTAAAFGSAPAGQASPPSLPGLWTLGPEADGESMSATLTDQDGHLPGLAKLRVKENANNFLKSKDIDLT